MNCPKCNKEVAEDIFVCPDCGTVLKERTEAAADTPKEGLNNTDITVKDASPAPKKKKPTVIIIIAVILVLLLIAGGTVGALFAVKAKKASRINEVIEGLENNTYIYYVSNEFDGIEMYTINSIYFLDDTNVKLATSLGKHGLFSTKEYEIELRSDDDVILKIDENTYELNFDSFGNVESLTEVLDEKMKEIIGEQIYYKYNTESDS